MNNVTLIDDLPNLDEMETTPVNINSRGLTMIPDPSRYKKFIRNSGMNTPIESGMQSSNKHHQMTYPPIKNNKIENDNLFPEDNIQGEYKPYIPASTYENFDIKFNPYLKNLNNQDVNCVQCAQHTENCTVCSKLYSNNNMVFIFIIIFQAIIILLLLKKILE